MTDEKTPVRYTAAAAVLHLTAIKDSRGNSKAPKEKIEKKEEKK
jgi:hypothetical protein